jgi:hypothetical protein
MLFKISIVLGVILTMGFVVYHFLRGCTWVGERCSSRCEPPGEQGTHGPGLISDGSAYSNETIKRRMTK